MNRNPDKDGEVCLGTTGSLKSRKPTISPKIALIPGYRLIQMVAYLGLWQRST